MRERASRSAAGSVFEPAADQTSARASGSGPQISDDARHRIAEPRTGRASPSEIAAEAGSLLVTEEITMRNWTKTAGILFMAASAVYSGRWIIAGTGEAQETSSREAKPAQDGSDPFASSPSTQPSDASPATQPSVVSKGQSVSAAQVNVNDAGTVEIHVNDANLVEVLRMLSLQSQKNIIASKEVHGTITANLYDVTVKEALDAVLHANGYDYREKGNFIYVYTTKEIQEMEQAARVKKTEIFRLYYTPAANAVNLLKPVLSADAQVALTTPAKAGLAQGATGAGGDDHAGDDMLVVTDFPENLSRAHQILREVDRRPQQVLVEATILRASLNENNQLGVDFTVLGGVNFSSLNALSAGSGSTSTTTGGPSPSNTVNSTLTGTIIDTPGAGPLLKNGYVNGNFGGSGLNLGVITNNVGIFLQALEAVTDTTVLANPKVLVLNKQQGEVHVGDNIGYKTAVTTETLTASTVSFLDTGIRLIFRPYIGDNGYIRLEIHPENSTGGLDTNQNPFKNTTEITTDVMVKDGRTIVIGGLFQDSTTRARSQVPFLGSLPGVGPLFRQQTDTTVRQEVIVLLTPHIIKDLDTYGDASDDEQKYADRLEIGARRGLMPWGRERLAESWYEMAVQEMNKPHPNRQLVLWHLNCAINLNPMFSEAMELRSQVTGRELIATDDSTIRSFVRRQILNDRVNPTTEPSPDPVVMIDAAPATRTEDAARPAAKPQPAASAGTVPDATQPAAVANNDVQPVIAPATQPSDELAAPVVKKEGAKDATATTNNPGDPFEDGPAASDVHK
jgi:type IV pilus assembly protein PilQ